MTRFELAHAGLRRFAPVLGIVALAVLVDRSPWLGKNVARDSADTQSVMTAYGAETGSVDRSMRDYKTPEQFAWIKRAGTDNQTVAVFGDPAKAGMYVQLLKRGPDDWSMPHSHPNDRYITVRAGIFKIGTGSKFDKENTVSLGPGSVVKDFANQMHYDGTGPEGATIEIVGMGPTSRN